MAGYTHLLALHILFAVLGIGPAAFMAAVAIKPPSRDALEIVIHRGNRIVGPSLGLMFLTGVGLLWVTGWTYMKAPWFIISFLLFLLIGALSGMMNSQLRKAGEGVIPGSFRALGWTLLVATAVIVWLMVTKP